jgi:gliding motility-associated-like protein
MLLNKRLFCILFVLQCVVFVSAQENSSCSLGKDVKICSNSIGLSTKSLLPGTWKIISGTGSFSSFSSSTPTVSNISDGVSVYCWQNNDNSCFDTISIIIPKMGVTSASVVGSGGNVSSTETKVSYGSIYKLSTSGSVLPPALNGVSFVAYFLYTCIPPLNPDVLNDACVPKGTFVNINNLKNDGTLVKSHPTPNQTYWVIPVLSNDITLKGPHVDSSCMKTGSPLKVTFLNDIVFAIKDHCKDGISEITISGGDAEFFNSSYTISNFHSKKGVLSTMSLKNGEVLTVSNLVNGETFTFDVTDAIGYTKTFSYQFPPCPACVTTIGYKTNYCRTDSIASPIFFNNSGIGRLKISPSIGVVWDTITGIVDVKNSKPGNYTVYNYASKSCAKKDSSSCLLVLSDTVVRPVGPTSETLCMPNPKVGNITDVVAQLITWYDKNGKKLDSEIDPVFDSETYYCTQTINGCESKKIGVKVYTPKVNPPIEDTIQFVCKENSPTLLNLKPNGTNISWYLTASGGVKLNTNTVVKETSYFASIKIGCESIKRLKVNVKYDIPPSPVLTSDTLRYCYSKELTVGSLVPFGQNFRWYGKQNDVLPLPSQSILEQGTYYLAYVNPNTKCQSARVKVRVFVTEILANVSVFEPNCDKNDGVLVANPSEGKADYHFLWSNGGTSNNLQMISSGDYLLKVTDAANCSMDTLIKVACRKPISSILTPNGDGKNDVWLLGYSARYPQVSVQVFNRWGNLVYQSPIPYVDDWDGKSNVLLDQDYLPTGTYFYQILKTPDSKPETGYLELVK